MAVTASEAIDILSVGMSRPLGRVLLRSLIAQGELEPTFSSGTINEVSDCRAVLAHFSEAGLSGFESAGLATSRGLQAVIDGFGVVDIALARVATFLGPNVANAITEARGVGTIVIRKHDIELVLPKIVRNLFEDCTVVDWDLGRVEAELPASLLAASLGADQVSGTILQVELGGMAFAAEDIVELNPQTALVKKRRGGPGRRAVHDWSSAAAAVLSQVKEGGAFAKVALRAPATRRHG